MRNLKREAGSAVRSGQFDLAGTKYTLTAYQSLGMSEFESLKRMSSGLMLLLRATLSYRLAGRERRATYRAEAGSTLAAEIRDYVADTDVERGVTFEYVGDFRTMAGLDAADEPYRRARELYEPYEEANDVGERIGQLSEPEFHDNTDLLRQLIDAAEFDLDEEEQAKIEFRSPVTRARFKAANMDDIVTTVVERGSFP